MTEGTVGLLEESSVLEMNSAVNVPKRQDSSLEPISLSSASLVALENATHYVSTGISVPGTLTLDSVMVTNPRSLSVSNAALHQNETLQTSADNGGAYSSMEYVSSPVVSLQDDQHAKFPDGLVHNGVELVEMNDSEIKNNPGPPLDLYFEVMPTTSASSLPPTSSYMPRHEHQTPKAQLLVRAYSDFIQPHEQQQQQIVQDHQAVHHPVAVQVNSNESQLTDADHPDAIMSDVLQVNFAQLEQAVMPTTIAEYRKPIKNEPQRRHLQLHMPSKHLSSLSKNRLEDHSDIHGQKLIMEQHAIQHEGHTHATQIEIENPMTSQTFVPATFVSSQHTQRYQLVQKPFSQQRLQTNSDFTIKQENLKNSFVNQNKGIEENTYIIHSTVNSESISNKHQGAKVESEPQFVTHHMPLVSRSGRPIRRRQEYIEYVNNHNEKDDDSLQGGDFSSVKVELFGNVEIEEEVGGMEEMVLEEEHEGDNSNDDDQDPSVTYSNDGKRSLPHKKRIARKLKSSRKTVKYYNCLECNEQFTNYGQFTQHKSLHVSVVDKPKMFSCELCTKAFDSQLKFFEHLKAHYEPCKKHKCEVCNAEFDDAQALHEHTTVHSREHFQCTVCNKTFRNQSMLELHTKTAHNHWEQDDEDLLYNKPYTCNSCPKSFRTQLTLDSHSVTEHSENVVEYNCEDCYRTFKSRAKLTAHRKAEHKEEITQGRGVSKKKKVSKANKSGFPCSHCPRTFVHKNSLVYHIRSHTGERPHQCEQCGKAFYAASALKVHQRLHSGEKPYKCKDCGKFFRQWGDLRYHTSSVHSDARQFQCEFCGKDFKRKYCLVVHRRIHTGEKKYKCEFCQKSFRASSYLQNHKRIHTGERPYPCPDCGKPFRVNSDMKRHRLTHMRDNNNSTTSNSQCVEEQSSNSNMAISTQSSTIHTQTYTTASTHHPNILSRHNQNQQVQILHGAVGSQGPLIIAEGVPTVISEQNPSFRIMVSLPSQVVSHSDQPPPAHRHSQVTGSTPLGVTTTTMSPTATAVATGSAQAPAGSAPTDVIIMSEGNHHQPINLNILPRLLAQQPQQPQQSTPDSGQPASGIVEEEGPIFVYSC